MVIRPLQTTVAWLIASVLAFNAVVAPVAHGPSCHRMGSMSDGCVPAESNDGSDSHSPGTCCGHFSSPAAPHIQSVQVGFNDGKFHGHSDNDCLACKYLVEFHCYLLACATCIHPTIAAAEPSTPIGFRKFLPHGLYLARGPPAHCASLRLFGV